MRKLILSVVVLLAFAVASQGQETPRAEVFAGYTGLRSNEPPAACGCFWMNGGSVSASYNLNSWVGMAGDFGAVHSGNVNSMGLDLTIASYLFGPRVSYRKHERFTLFGQFLMGWAYQNGSLRTALSGPKNEFATSLGGGLDVKVTHYIAIRPFQLEYFHTGFANGVNGSQNNFRFSSGVVFRLGHL
jgi:outer membrane immunogenic protein